MASKQQTEEFLNAGEPTEEKADAKAILDVMRARVKKQQEHKRARNALRDKAALAEARKAK